MKKLSIIFPWRERVEFIRNMIKSLKETTKNPSEIEILIVIDDDDVVALHHKPVFEEEFKPFETRIFVVKRSEHFTKDYVNFLAKKSNARWILPINDDVLFRTQNWDEIAITRMEQHAEKIGDDFIVGILKDDINRQGEDPKYPHWSCWNIASKASVDFLNYLYDERCYVWSVDHIISDLYKAIGDNYNNDPNARRVSLVDVYIEHFSGHSGKRHFDGNYWRMADIERRAKSQVTHEEVIQESIKIVNHLKEIHV